MDAVEILRQLVAYPTVSSAPNLPLIDWVRNFLSDHRVSSHLVLDASGRKSNLIATLGPAEAGGLVFSGHTDVVPTDDQAWSSDPFKLTTCGSRLHARGACDMKGFIAAVLARVPVWKAQVLRRPVHLMFSYDEEVGCLGAPSMIAEAARVLPAPAAVIVGEPTGMRVTNRHKGVCNLLTRVTGIAAHSSLTHRGVSAVMLAADLIAHLSVLSRKLAADRAGHDPSLEPPHTTLSVNRIHGGTATNILAATCEFEWEIRRVAGERGEFIFEDFSAFARARLAELLAEGKSCTVETLTKADVPALVADGGLAERIARAAAQCADEGIAVPFGTEAGQFQRAGWSTVVCGPGSIEQAHQPDEFIERSELAACEAFLDRAVTGHCH